MRRIAKAGRLAYLAASGLEVLQRGVYRRVVVEQFL
jgi:hypothetical protein